MIQANDFEKLEEKYSEAVDRERIGLWRQKWLEDESRAKFFEHPAFVELLEAIGERTGKIDQMLMNNRALTQDGRMALFVEKDCLGWLAKLLKQPGQNLNSIEKAIKDNL